MEHDEPLADGSPRLRRRMCGGGLPRLRGVDEYRGQMLIDRILRTKRPVPISR